MKNIILLITILTSITSCRFDTNISSLENEIYVAKVKNQYNGSMRYKNIDEISWLNFANEYLSAFAKLYNYQNQTLALNGNSKMFYNEIRNDNISKDDSEFIYQKYGLDFDLILTYQNEMDNAVYKFVLINPEILEVGSQLDFEQELLSGIGSIIGQVSPLTSVNLEGFNVSWDEVWDCAVDAVGLGFVSYIGLKTLKKVGATIITKAITKALIKFAGPIGSAIMIAEFAACIYDASQN